MRSRSSQVPNLWNLPPVTFKKNFRGVVVLGITQTGTEPNKKIKGRKNKHLTDHTWMDIVEVVTTENTNWTQGESLYQRGEREMFQAPFFYLRLCPCTDYIRECIANAKDHYRGRRFWTKSNITCQPWADNSINEHT